MLLGDNTVTYPAYVPPSTAGITMAFGAQSPQEAVNDIALSDETIAQAAATGMGATLANGNSYGSADVTFVGLTPGSPIQPWVIVFPVSATFPDGAWQFAGFYLKQQAAANGGVMGKPGAWKNQVWTPALPPPPPPPVVAPVPTDPNAFADSQGAGALPLGMPEALYWLRAIGAFCKLPPYSA
jgi:hypothetical protein